MSADARKLWAKLMAEYEFSDAASEVMLRELCGAVDSLRRCQQRISADGLTVDGRAHPLLAAEDRYRRTILAHVRALRISLPEI